MRKPDIDWDKYPAKIHPMIAHGVEITGKSGTQLVGTLPWSEREGKLYIDGVTGQYHEKHLDEGGNVTTFLNRRMQGYLDITKRVYLTKLARDRKVSTWACTHTNMDIACDGYWYFIPTYNEKINVTDIRRYSLKSRRWMTTKGCKPGLGGVRELVGTRQSEAFVVEGENDAMALRWLLWKIGDPRPVVWLPGAGTLKRQHIDLFQHYGVKPIWCFDNDDAGDKGAKKARQLCKEAMLDCKWLNWDDDWPVGHDVNDFVSIGVENDFGLDVMYKALLQRVEEVHKRDDGSGPDTQVKSPIKVDTFSDLMTWESPPQQIEPFWPLGSVACLYGLPGGGKTFFAQSAGYQISIGKNLLDGAKHIEQGKVLYVSGEGRSGLGKRAHALVDSHGVMPKDFSFVTEGIDLLDHNSRARFVDLVGQMKPSLVVLDTLARTIGGGDENSASDMGKYIAAVDAIRDASGGSVLIVHHSNKSDARNERGSSALRGAADVMINCVKDRHSGVVTLRCEKSKDSAPFHPIHLRLEEVQLSAYPGETSCVLVPSDAPVRKSHADCQKFRSLAKINKALRSSPEPMTYKQIIKNSGCCESTVKKHLPEMVKTGGVVRQNRGGTAYFSLEKKGKS